MASSKQHFSVEDIYSAADLGKHLSDYDVKDKRGYTALMLAVARNNLQVLRALLEAGADVNVSRSSDGSYTALSLAVDKGHTTAVRELLQHGAFLSCEKGIEALDMAREKVFLDAVVKGEELLIKQNKEILMDGKTGVFQAFKTYRLDLVKNLVIAGSYISLLHKSTYTFRNNKNVLLQQLINDGIDTNLVFKEKTALVMAIVFDSPTCVEILLKSKANVNFVNKNKWTPLHIAARKDEHIVKLLIEAGAEVNAETCEGETPLHLAASMGDIKTIQHLVAAGGLINSQDKNGDSVLMKATKRSSNVKEICTYLVKSGANVNIPNKFGVQPIVNILDIDCLELMQLFLEHGADVNACDSMGRSILSLAIWRRKREITNLLLLKSADVNFMFNGEVPLLLMAVQCGDVEVVKTMLEMGADVNLMFNGEVPLLIMAVKLGDVEVVKTMLEMGADVTKADINGNTPLHVAVDEFKFRQSWTSCLENRDKFICVYSKEGVKLHLTPPDYLETNPIIPQEFPSLGMEKCCDLVKILIEAGADVKISSESGIQPIVNILDFDSSELVELFLEHGADVNSCDSNGRSILSLAVWNRKEEIANLLISKGAEVNCMLARQVLVMAVRLGYVELVQKMLEMGADVTQTDNNGNTPLHYSVIDISHCTCSKKYDNIAIKRHVYFQSLGNTIQEDNVNIAARFEIVNVLIRADSNINQVNNKLESPLHIAIAQNIFVKDKHIKDIKKTTISNQLPSAETDKEDILNQPLLGCAEHGVKNRFAYNPNDTCFIVTIERNAYLQSLEYNLHKDNEWRLKILKILLKTGCNVNQLNIKLESPLCLAIRHKELVELLIESKADVNLTGRNKQTALHLAASGPEEIVKMLIDAGADVNAEIQTTYSTVESDTDIEDIGRENLDYLSHSGSFFDRSMGHSYDTKDESFSDFRVRSYLYSKKPLFKDTGPKNTTTFVYGETPLHIAARSGDIESLKHLVAAGASVNALDESGNSALSKAIESNIIKNIKYVVQFDGAVLTLALYRQYKDIAMCLVESGADVNVVFDGHLPALSMAVMLDDVELVKKMITHGADVNKTDRDGYTSLHVALSFGYDEVISIKYILKEPYNTDATIIMKNRFELVEILIEAGANINQTNNALESPLHIAVKVYNPRRWYLKDETDDRSKYDVIWTTLINHGAKVSTSILYYCLSSKQFDQAGVLLKTNGPKNTTTFEYGETPLHIAARSGEINSLKHLVAAGASVNALDKNGNSALSKAIESNIIEKIKYFVQFDGAALTACEGRTDSVLTIALYRRYKEIAMCLVESGADVNVVFDRHLSALSMAVMLDDVELVKKMITHGADVNKTDSDGNTSLHVALTFGYDEVIFIKYILKESYDNTDATIIMKNRCELVDILIEAGANINQTNNALESPLHIAIKVYNLRRKYCKYDTDDPSKYEAIWTTLINHDAKVSTSILYHCLSNGQFDQAGVLLKNSACHLVDKNFRNLFSYIVLSQFESIFKKSHFEILQMLVYNGIVLTSKTLVSVSGKTISLTSLMLAIIYRHVDLAKYLLATGYMTAADLRQLRQFDESPEDLHNILGEINKQPTVSTCELQSLIHEVVSQPWPLVKLALISVSTMFGEGLERDERLSQANLPHELKQLLMFQTPVSLLPVSEWPKMKIRFDLLDRKCLSNIHNFWPFDVLYSQLRHKLQILRNYTENRSNKFSLHHRRHLTEDVLKATFDLRGRCVRLNKDQIQELEPLVEECISSIDACIYYHGNTFNVDKGPQYLVLRSGLQFMLEDFESLQLEYSERYSEFTENVEFFTERLKNWQESFGTFCFYENVTHRAEDLRKPDGIPEEHTWWFPTEFK